MKNKTIHISIVVILIIATAALATTVVDLSARKQDDQETINRLSRQVSDLQTHVSVYQKEKDAREKNEAVARFKTKVFQSRYPGFTDVAEIVYEKSSKYGFSPYLVMAVIQVESNFEPYAVSNAGAYGLMQVNYSVWKDALAIDYSRIFHKEYNIELGLQILKRYYDKSGGNMFMALYRYNNGYKYNNTGYNGKILATKFFALDKKIKSKADSKNNQSF